MIAFESLPALALLAQAGPAVADTVVTIAAGPTGLQRWVDLLTSIASIVIALVLIVIAVSLVPAAWNSRKLYRRINDALDRTHQGVGPVLKHAENAAANVNYIASAVREDAERVRGLIRNSEERLDRAATLAEQRIQELNALLEVVQEEAEQLFIDTASTLRGVRAGASTLTRRRSEPRWEEEEEVEIEVEPRRRPRG